MAIARITKSGDQPRLITAWIEIIPLNLQRPVIRSAGLDLQSRFNLLAALGQSEAT